MEVENLSEEEKGVIVEKISKRISLSKDNFKKVKIAIEALDIDKKEVEAINDVVNEAIEYFFQERVVKKLNSL